MNQVPSLTASTSLALSCSLALKLVPTLLRKVFLALASVALLQPMSSSANDAVEVISGQGGGQSRATARSGQSRTHAPRNDAASSFSPTPLRPLIYEHPRRKAPKQKHHRLDLNQDGFVSSQELKLSQEAKQLAFRSADHNQDGKLDSQEMKHFRKMTEPRKKTSRKANLSEF